MKAILVCLGCFIASAATAGPNQMPAVKAFERCTAAAFVDLVVAYENIPKSWAVERAFQSCLTEEQAISASFLMAGFEPNLAAFTLARIKLNIKQFLMK